MRFYEYFISSLASLDFPGQPPISYGKFLEECARFIPEKDYQVLASLPTSGNSLIKRYQEFETALRNQIALFRGQALGKEASKYLRPDVQEGAEFAHIAQQALENPSILEAEIFLDQQRWAKLDELSLCHFFDLEFLIIYAHKLLILQRWEKIKAQDKELLWNNLLSVN